LLQIGCLVGEDLEAWSLFSNGHDQHLQTNFSMENRYLKYPENWYLIGMRRKQVLNKKQGM